MSPLQSLQTLRHGLGVDAAVEGADAEIAFAFRAEAAAGGDDDVRFGENSVERLPAGKASRGFHPEVRRVHAAENFQAGVLRARHEHGGIAQVMLDERADLRLAFGRVERFRPTLDDVAYAVELRRHAPMPERVQRLE